MHRHPRCAQVDVATRAHPGNADFFAGRSTDRLWAAPVGADFAFYPNGRDLLAQLRPVAPQDYALIWLRLPPPLSPELLTHLETTFAGRTVINNPAGIRIAGSKDFLVRFADLCPPLRICRSVADIEAFKARFPIVLKPFRDYGGRGVVRIEGDTVWRGDQQLAFAEFVAGLPAGELDYLAVKFLKNVDQGDKRIIVVNGEIMGASLRLPPPDSWLCNVAMGGTSRPATPDADEREIVRRIQPELNRLGIVMYGIDTLVNDDGRRVLSEINTTSIGGLAQSAGPDRERVVARAIELIWAYFLRKNSSPHA
jgi:glutathione synthase